MNPAATVGVERAMARPLALFAIGLVFGGGIGFVLAAGAGVTLDGHDHTMDRTALAHHDVADDHAEPHRLSPSGDAPTVLVDLAPDPVSGWNLHAKTANFAFAPEQAGGIHRAGEGHAHVYLDGDKIARLYGPWMHLSSVPDGATVTVTLNGNDLRPLFVGDRPLSATAVATRD